VHPGGIKTAIARNSTAAAGQDTKALAELFDKRLARTTPEAASRVILRGVQAGRPRVLIGSDARALDALVRLTGSGYQRVVATVAGRMLPR